MLQTKITYWLLVVVMPVISATSLFAQQDNSPVFGFEVRPIIPSSLFRTGSSESSIGETHFTIGQTPGYVFGAVVNARIYKNLEMETGICFTQRNFSMVISEESFTGTSSFRIIGYEIPVSALVSIPLTESFRMNNSLGVALDAFPSDIATSGAYYLQEAVRMHYIIPALIANSGIKYTTYQSGAFYLGASYHLPFSNIYTNSAKYTLSADKPILYSPLRGNYFTVDIKYFFPYHKPPPKKKKNKFGGTNDLQN